VKEIAWLMTLQPRASACVARGHPLLALARATAASEVDAARASTAAQRDRLARLTESVREMHAMPR
jgi:hypothetical protein